MLFLLERKLSFENTGLKTLFVFFNGSEFLSDSISLTATLESSIDFYSLSYLDVSVRLVNANLIERFR